MNTFSQKSASVVNSVPAQSLTGQLNLEFVAGQDDKTVLNNPYRNGLFHFAKPYSVENGLFVQAVNPTAGIFSGDQLESRIRVHPRASGAVISPASTQVYAMPNGKTARSKQFISVAAGGSFIYRPRWLVLHAGARLQQEQKIFIDPEARFFFADYIAAGRSAKNEFNQFDHFDSLTELHLGERLLFKERMLCGHDLNTHIWNIGQTAFPYLLTVIVVFPKAGVLCEQTFSHLELTDDCRLGYSIIHKDVVILKIISTGNLVAEKLYELACRMLEVELPMLRQLNRIR